jgi:hypothetical protein
MYAGALNNTAAALAGAALEEAKRRLAMRAEWTGIGVEWLRSLLGRREWRLPCVDVYIRLWKSRYESTNKTEWWRCISGVIQGDWSGSTKLGMAAFSDTMLALVAPWNLISLTRNSSLLKRPWSCRSKAGFQNHDVLLLKPNIFPGCLGKQQSKIFKVVSRKGNFQNQYAGEKLWIPLPCRS